MSSQRPTRSIGPWTCLALVMGSMIGSGVFLLPASLAPYGWNAVGAWGFTIVGVLLIVLQFARLTRAFPHAEGSHGFVGKAYGPLAAFAVSWSYWVGVCVGNAAIATAAISYLSLFVPAIGADPHLSALLTIALLWALTLVNLRGAHVAGRVQLATMAIKLVPMIVVIALIAVVLSRTGVAALAPFPTDGLHRSDITAAAALTLWALVGFEAASLAHARVRNPERTIPRMLMTGALLTGLIYLVVCTGIALMLPPDVAAASNAPFADFVARFWSPGPALAVGLFASISAIGTLNGLILVQGELLSGMARSGELPRWWAALNAHGAPARAMIVSSLLTTLLIAFNASKSLAQLFTFLALMSTASTLLLYLGVVLASLRLRTGGVLGLLALVFTLWTLWGAGLDATGWSLVLAALALPIYWIMRSGAPQPPPKPGTV